MKNEYFLSLTHFGHSNIPKYFHIAAYTSFWNMASLKIFFWWLCDPVCKTWGDMKEVDLAWLLWNPYFYDRSSFFHQIVCRPHKGKWKAISVNAFHIFLHICFLPWALFTFSRSVAKTSPQKWWIYSLFITLPENRDLPGGVAKIMFTILYARRWLVWGLLNNVHWTTAPANKNKTFQFPVILLQQNAGKCVLPLSLNRDGSVSI